MSVEYHPLSSKLKNTNIRHMTKPSLRGSIMLTTGAGRAESILHPKLPGDRARLGRAQAKLQQGSKGNGCQDTGRTIRFRQCRLRLAKHPALNPTIRGEVWWRVS